MDGAGVAGLPGAASAFLPGGVVPLDRPRAVFEAMLEGWATQQRARFLRQGGTIGPRLDLVRRFACFIWQYPLRELALGRNVLSSTRPSP